ncbi:MAG: GatB/YqeY domain-containing protein [Phototrophicales bacterium]|nr:GatB/YqeY domain-containing protein [Phototrophicales bacterium]
MTDPKAFLSDALKEAMKSRDNATRDVLRLLQSAIKQVEVDSRKEVTSEDVMDILQKEAKKRRESIVDYEKGNRQDLADEEKAELVIIEKFLPKQLTADELREVVRGVITETGATSAKDLNKVMPAVMAKVKGLADGKLVSQIVKELLG